MIVLWTLLVMLCVANDYPFLALVFSAGSLKLLGVRMNDRQYTGFTICLLLLVFFGVDWLALPLCAMGNAIDWGARL